MFNDRYGLTEAVLSGQKTQTRRIITNCTGIRLSPFCQSGVEDNHGYELKPKYYVGEIVAIAQSYKDTGVNPTSIIGLPIKGSKTHGVLQCEAQCTPGWDNKLFVRADLMPHHIRITNVRVERLQDISDEDCIKEGIYKDETSCFNHCAYDYYKCINNYVVATRWYNTPREAYAALIDHISGKGTWDSNPYVFVYDFELVK